MNNSTIILKFQDNINLYILEKSGRKQLKTNIHPVESFDFG